MTNKCSSVSMMYFIQKIPTITFRPALRPSSGRVCYKRIQKYKFGKLFHHHSIIIEIIISVKIIKVKFIYLFYLHSIDR
jgi:hypothetical protein